MQRAAQSMTNFKAPPPAATDAGIPCKDIVSAAVLPLGKSWKDVIPLVPNCAT